KGALLNYRYEAFAGHVITVYVVDTSPFDLTHEEFTAPSTDVTRRELNVARNRKSNLEDNQGGTCVASKTVGVTTGEARRASLVDVRIDFTEFGLLGGIQAVSKDTKQKGLKDQAVVTTSILMRAPDAVYTTPMRSVIRGLTSLDIPVVAAAGGKSSDNIAEPDELPAAMAKGFSVIVIDSGISFAAPQVAGMMAYWVSHLGFVSDLAPGSVAETLRIITGALPYRRVAEAGYPPIAWDGHDLA
ncbi:hypothetical protein LX32DRAFT_510559, partial [Colletotrichum zoysiae]